MKEIRIEPNCEIIEKHSCLADKDLLLYIPISVKRIKHLAIDGSAHGKTKYQLHIFYEGTFEEWKQILKGTLHYVTIEDWYGYYYHNTSRYDVGIEYLKFYNDNLFEIPIIHCSDGEFPDEGAEKFAREHQEEALEKD